MKRVYDWDQIKIIARKARLSIPPPSRPRIRRIPRDDGKSAALYRMATDRMKKYPPALRNRKLFLPYFSDLRRR